MVDRTGSGRTENELLFDYFFGENRCPAMCNSPNLVLGNVSPSLPLVLDTVGCRGGAWEIMPRFARTGGPYLGDENEKHGYFRTWGTEENQRWLRERGGIVNLSMFTMLLDIETPDEYFDWLSRRLLDIGYCPLFDDMDPLIAERIEDIRWAYFPLTDEYPLAMFVVRPDDARWVDELETAIQESGGSCCRVFREGERYAWRLPDGLKRLCTRDPDRTIWAPGSEETSS